jgi:hypothetical protein
MSANVIPFPPPHVRAIAGLAADANRRWIGSHAPMIQVAIEILDMDAGELRAKTLAIVDQDAEGLLAETDRALAETAGGLAALVEGIALARERLHSALVGANEARVTPMAKAHLNWRARFASICLTNSGDRTWLPSRRAF